MGCRKAQGFLEANGLQVDSRTDAGQERKRATEALALARQVRKIVVARGRKTVTFDLKKDRPDEATLLAHLLGPTGNLRAPTLRAGDVLLVGFGDLAYEEVLGKG